MSSLFRYNARIRSLKHGLYAGLLLTIAGTGGAFAQQNLSLDNAVTVATRWAMEADTNQADAMWQSSAPVMQSNIKKDDWHKYLVNLHQQLGASQTREWLQVARVDNPSGLPSGNYLNVIFLTKYAKSTTFETVSMVLMQTGWQPVGYVVRPVQTQAPAPSAPSK